MRHNNLRDLNVAMQKEVCRDVVSEPSLLPVTDQEIEGTTADRAAPDISSRGLWSTFERTFFDVRVLHPNAPSYRSSDLNTLYRNQELEKMRKYNSRVITVERGSFTPLIYTTNGGMGPQARDGKCDTLAAIIPVKIFPFLRGISLKLVKNGLKMKKNRQK